MSATLRLPSSSRIDSLDLVRGIIMVLMLLDHGRDFFHQYAFQFEPDDLTKTAPITFYTRWITHICAPAFAFLAGVSAFLYGNREGRTKKDLLHFLLTRGFFLIILEETVISLAWRFSIDLTFIRGLVIWALGWSMIGLGGLIFLNKKIVLWFSILVLAFHNLLDPVDFDNKILQSIWAFFHETCKIEFFNNENPAKVIFTWRILYPVLPMLALMALGYRIGEWYKKDFKSDIRQGMLFNTGLILISAFILLRFLQFVFKQYDYVFYLNLNDLVTDSDSNVTLMWKNIRYTFKSGVLYFIQYFGDPLSMEVQDSTSYTLMSFLKVSKYPFSTFYILITLGPLLLLLSAMETLRIPGWCHKFLKTIGSVPMFYYIVHLFLLRLLAILILVVFYREKFTQLLNGTLKNVIGIFEMNMFAVYAMCILCLALLYPLCRWYSKKKSTGKSWIYSYI